MGREEDAVADNRAALGDDEDRASSDAIGPLAEDGCEEELEDGVGGSEEGQEEDVRDAESLSVVLLIGQKDAKADEINKDNKKNRGEGFAHATARGVQNFRQV